MANIAITTTVELEQEKVVGAQVAGVELVAVACQGGIHVYEGYCPHQGTLLSEGHVENGRLICRGHGWQFHCAGGQKIDDPQICLHQFSATVSDGQVCVNPTEINAWATGQEKEAIPAGKQPHTQPLLSIDQLPGPPGLPLLGNLHQLKTDIFHLILEEWYRQYGDTYQFRLGRQRVLVLADPQMVQQVLQERPEHFSRLNDIRKTIEEMEVEGLFSAEGEQWRRHRHFAGRAFDVRHLREFFPTLMKVTGRLHRRWQRLAAAGSPIDVQKEFMRYTVDVTTNLAFGYDMNTLEEEGDRIQKHIEVIFPMIAYRTFMPVRYWNTFKLPADRVLDAAVAELHGSINQFIATARQQMAADPALHDHPQNLLQALLAAQAAANADEDIEFSDREIYGNVFTFLLAGEDTTANSMAWMMYFMAAYPEIQGHMQAEADAVLGDDATATDYQKIAGLRYIEAVAHETMRFKPVAPFVGMQALTDVTINGLRVPGGMPILLLLRVKGLEDSEFPQADTFNPQRWLNYSRQENPHHRKSFLPFGAGPRLCPGRSLALLEIKMAMSMIARHFDVRYSNGRRADPGRDITERFTFTMMPENLLMTLHPRAN